jgi:5'-3' exonuclease
VADKILANIDMARLSQELATIHLDVPLPYSLLIWRHARAMPPVSRPCSRT